MCFSETWLDAYLSVKIRIFNFQVIRSYIKQEKIVREEEFVFLCVKVLALTKWNLSINCDTIYSLSTEISTTKSKNIFLNTIYRPPNGDMKQRKNHFKNAFSKNSKNLKKIIQEGDLSINFLDFETNKKCKTF